MALRKLFHDLTMNEDEMDIVISSQAFKNMKSNLEENKKSLSSNSNSAWAD